MVIECPVCKINTNHSVKTEIRKDILSVMATKDFGSNPYDMSFFYQTVECLECNFYSYRTYAEIFNCPSEEEEYKQTLNSEVLYPERISKRNRVVKKFSLITDDIARQYTVIIELYNQGLNIPCGSMLRTFIEILCDSLIKKYALPGAPFPTLQEKIDSLFKSKKINEKDFRLFHAIRKIANRIVHGQYTPNDSELKLHIDRIEETLSSIFDYDFD